ncbi:large subunit GTPase 1 [Plakobranchus ocellatus]|uniref:Large subunit GTPase 1 n=1 Tax=Plakobranchus ocellatus TaxID=259542 RepID=A0AAV3ZXU0_9GAST|nr:large subunit GTPase 1 [Plakobranchus ocellatus]
MEHPGFFGAFFLHGNSDFRVFTQFFQHIALEFADSPNPVLNSDEEKAMRNAMAFAFPDAGILTCNRHLRGNCINYLTDKIDVPHGPKIRLLSTIFGANCLLSIQLSEGKAHSRGKLGVADHVRVDTLQPSARQTEAPADIPVGAVGRVVGSHSSLASVPKPWKKHNNRNKKEKLRRVHRDLDVC